MMSPHRMLIVISALLGVTAALVSINEGPDGELTGKSPVYFPILPEDFKDFGIKLGGSGSPPLPKKLDMPHTTTKPTTTTVRLPINEHGYLNHIANEAVTNPPGPSYLTDSYYYVEDHTKAPGTGGHSSEESHHGDRESEDRGAEGLQQLTPLRPHSFGEKMPSSLALAEPLPPPSFSSRSPVIRPRLPALSTTPPPPVLTTTPAPVLSSPAPTRPPKNMKLRPAFTPIPTPAPRQPPSPSPSYSRAPSRLLRPAATTPYTPVRVSSTTTSTTTPLPPPTTRPSSIRARRPKTQPSSFGAKTRAPASRPASVTVRRRPTSPSSSYRTPSPPTPTTTPARTYDSRVPSGSAPRRQYVRKGVTTKPDESPVYRTSTKAYRAPSSLYHVRGATTTVTAPSQPDFVQTDPNIYVPHEYDEEAIPGEAGIDYPNFDTVPDTSFSCDAQEHPGLYADTEAQCQTFHICQEDGRQDSFLCPNGTVFNQQYFVCDWWYNFSCDHASRFYSLNALIYELPVQEKYSRK